MLHDRQLQFHGVMAFKRSREPLHRLHMFVPAGFGKAMTQPQRVLLPKHGGERGILSLGVRGTSSRVQRRISYLASKTRSGLF
jgi:hypothetical protein